MEVQDTIVREEECRPGDEECLQIREKALIAERAKQDARIDGAVSAAFLSSAIGCLFIGIMTTGAVISEGLKNMLNWWDPAGPLSGKTGIGVAAWLISWAVFHLLWRNNKEVKFGRIFAVSLILIGIGFALTFPPVFEAFE